jgi:hypothetical protein
MFRRNISPLSSESKNKLSKKPPWSRQKAELCFSYMFLAWLILRPWWWKWQAHPKRRLNFNGLHGIVPQRIKLVINTAVRTSNPTTVAHSYKQSTLQWDMTCIWRCVQFLRRDDSGTLSNTHYNLHSLMMQRNLFYGNYDTWYYIL